MSASSRRRVSVFGCTGSIGRNTVELLAGRPEDFQVEALTAGSNVDLLCRQARRLRARVAVIGDSALYPRLREGLDGTDVHCAAGASGLLEAAARPVDWSMIAIVGLDCLAPALQVAAQGGCIAMANKECLAAAGRLFVQAAQRSGATLLPVDSEHNAIFQLFDPARAHWVDHITLTASGGPFRACKPADLHQVTPEQAMRHPNWSMGAKISIDSATLMNKALELIEAHWLFPVGHEKFRVVIHPQSIVHALISYIDGSVLAHMSAPDMRVPIAHALAWPERMAAPGEGFDLAAVGALEFEPACESRWPALALARRALESGDGAATVLNAANEVAVAAFLRSEIRFPAILPTVANVLDALERRPGAFAPAGGFEEVLALDREARRCARESLQAHPAPAARP